MGGTRIGTFVKINRWLLVSLVVLGIAVYFSLTYVRQLMAVKSTTTAAAKMVNVVVPTVAVPAYTPLAAKDLTVEAVPAATAPPGSYPTVAALTGQWSNEALAPGDPIVSSEVFAPKAANILAARIHRGDMAVDLPLGATSAVDGLIQPGDTISLFTTITEKNGEQVTEDFMNGIKVLAVNGSLTPPTTPTTGQSLTLILALPPEKIATLLFVERKGGVEAVLDSPNATVVPPKPYGTLNWQRPVP